MQIELFEHQKKALEWAKNKTAYAFFFEPRTGKTITSLLSLRQHKVNYALVIAPLNAFSSWKRDCALLGIPFYEKEIIKPGQKGVYIWNYEAFSQDKVSILLRDFLNDSIDLYDFIIETHKNLYPKDLILALRDEYKATKNKDLLNKLKRLIRYHTSNKADKYVLYKSVYLQLKDVLKNIPKRHLAIVLDESHRIKNPRAASTKQILSLRQYFYVRNILSGTPIEKWEDLYTQMKFLDDAILPFKNYTEYVNFIAYTHPEKNFITGYRKKNIEKVKKLISPYIMSVKYSDVFPDQVNLAGSKDFEIPVDISNEEVEEWILDYEMDPENFNPLTEINLMYKLSDGFDENKVYKENKLKKLKELVGKLQQPIIIWTWFQFSAHEIANYLKRHFKDIPIFVNTGQKKTYEEFVKNKKGILITTYCVKEGQDFSFCNNVIYFKLPYAWRDFIQSYNRVINPNKKVPVNVYFLLTEFDEYIRDIVLKKKSNILSHIYQT